MKASRCVYVAGPYSADNVLEVLDNIRRGTALAADVLQAGFAVWWPWADAALVQIRSGFSVAQLRANSMAWLERSDAVLVARGWERSVGTCAEIDRATALGIPVYYCLGDLVKGEGNAD